ncbi:hypothetical protein TNIN_318941 [Trichonephila inaurata madagascariensis]|uniref:Uncharacterized protein n=1 Tax=Trichonephila inaurata madagascariensis TaxID=2747483 RepID=A0A8X6YPE3_9ARAC|nr:hypothetical protein TNIN_318941 [Trichonephila inaurata madagascariensis]
MSNMTSGAVANHVQDNIRKVCGHYPSPPNFQSDGQCAQQQDGITALHIAVNNVKEDAIRLLLSRKADPFVPYGV